MPAVLASICTTRATFELALRERGYNVRLAANGREALDRLNNCSMPDLIILDMFTPGMDGWQFRKRRDTRLLPVPVLILTALSIASDEWAVSLGAVGVLYKPIDMTVVVRKIGECLHH